MVDWIFRTEAEKGLVLVPPFHIAVSTTPSGGVRSSAVHLPVEAIFPPSMILPLIPHSCIRYIPGGPLFAQARGCPG